MRIKHVLVILVLLALALPSSAHAGGVVTVCDEAHLLAALAGGGTVTFACSGAITLTNTILIAADTTIDGSGQVVTISGNHAVRVLIVNDGVMLHLNSLTVADGYISSGYGDGIYSAGTGNTLTVSNSNFSANSRGAIFSERGALTVSNCTFSGNGFRGGLGGAIVNNAGRATVNKSTFSWNRATSGGGAILNSSGTMTVTNSTFSFNRANYGGGIRNHPASTLIVSNSTFMNNSVMSGGGILTSGTLTVRDSTFSGNTATYHGGGIHNGYPGVVTVSNSTFMTNSVMMNGGGIYNAFTGTTIVDNSTFYGNFAIGRGGGIANDYDGLLTVSNSTLSNNSAASGGGVWSGEGAVTTKNTVIASNLWEGNCAGAITDGGGNLSYPDTTCPGLNADPLLGPLQDNGGPTWTMALGPGSAAIDAGDDAICAADPVNNLDQRGVVRPQGAHCDSGALEQLRRWLPIMLAQ